MKTTKDHLILCAGCLAVQFGDELVTSIGWFMILGGGIGIALDAVCRD